MCTLSWWIEDEDRGVFFNRDEKRTRSAGLPPSLHQVNGRKLLMPMDPDAGGTWIGVNDSGLIVAVLNNYPYHQELVDARSRGLLVVDLLRDFQTAAEVGSFIGGANLEIYRGFIIFALGRSGEPVALRWDGRLLESLALSGPEAVPVLTTSSVRREDCEGFRNQLFHITPREPDLLRALHQRHHPDDPALGPLMCREDAATDSLLEIHLRSNEAKVCFQSVSGNPPEAGQILTETLELSN